MKAILLATILVLGVVSLVLTNGNALAATPYKVITDTKVCTNDNNQHEVYLRATDNSVDSQGEHRNLLVKGSHPSKLTVDYVSTPGKYKIIQWSFYFDPKVIIVPKLRVYGLLDDTAAKDYQYQAFSLSQHYYHFHFHLTESGATCTT